MCITLHKEAEWSMSTTWTSLPLLFCVLWRIIDTIQFIPKEELSCSLTEMFPIWSCLQEERLF